MFFKDSSKWDIMMKHGDKVFKHHEKFFFSELNDYMILKKKKIQTGIRFLCKLPKK